MQAGHAQGPALFIPTDHRAQAQDPNQGAVLAAVADLPVVGRLAPALHVLAEHVQQARKILGKDPVLPGDESVIRLLVLVAEHPLEGAVDVLRPVLDHPVEVADPGLRQDQLENPGLGVEALAGLAAPGFPGLEGGDPPARGGECGEELFLGLLGIRHGHSR